MSLVAGAEIRHLQGRLPLGRHLQEHHLIEGRRHRVVEWMRGVGGRGGGGAVDPAPLALMFDLDGAVADGALPAPSLVGALDAVRIEEEDRIARACACWCGHPRAPPR